MNRTQLNRIDSNVEVSKKRLFNNTSKTNSKRAKTTSAH